MHQYHIFILLNGGRGDGTEGMGDGRIITMVCDFGEPAPPKKDLGARPLNSLNLNGELEYEFKP